MPNLSRNTNMPVDLTSGNTANYVVGFTTLMVGGTTPFTCPSGRTYSGNLISISRTNADIDYLRGAGWQIAADHTGTTAQRPVDLEQGGPLPGGFRYYDTTLSATVIWTPRGWVNPLTGALA